jgi:hypothetical protein
MQDFAVSEIETTLVPTDSRALDSGYWWGNALRGALGTSLRFLLCRRRGTPCATCVDSSSCDFPRLWQPERGHTSASRGPRFRLAPWLLHTCVVPAGLKVHLRLFGTAARDSWRWRVALELAAARGIGPGLQVFRIEAPLTLRESTLHALAPPSPPTDGPLVVRLLSPLRLVEDGHPLRAAPSFSTLVAAAERRLRLAQLCWSETPPPPNTSYLEGPRGVAIVSARIGWQELTRYSRRQQRLMHLGGLTGEITYAQGWAPFWSVLGPAVVLHLGKLTTMGLGEIGFGPG